MLRRQSILHGDEDRAQLARDLHAERVLHLDVADDKTPAMDVEQAGPSGRGRRVVGRVDPDGHCRVAGAARDLAVVDDDAVRVDVCVERGDHLHDELARTATSVISLWGSRSRIGASSGSKAYVTAPS